MPIRQPRYPLEEAGRRGDAIYDRDVRAQLEPRHNGEIVAINLDSGAWEVDPDQQTAAERLEAQYPYAQVWVVRVGSRPIGSLHRRAIPVYNGRERKRLRSLSHCG